MKYFLLNADCKKAEQIPVKVSSKLSKICARMAKLSKQHAKLDRELIKEFARTNNISEDEASDIMAFNNFFVDSSQYGLGEYLKDLTKEEYMQLKLKWSNNELH